MTQHPKPSPPPAVPYWRRRLHARQIEYLRSEPDPNSALTTAEEMDLLFGGLPEANDKS